MSFDTFDAMLMIALPLLGATDEPGFLTSLFTNILLWGRVALGIGLVIFVHELGHFVAAKSFGVKCEKFYVGFDPPIKIGPIKFPRTLGKFTYGETEYGIGVIPLGGYVKMLGQDDDPRKLEEESKRIQVDSDVSETPVLDPRSFPAKPVWQRMIIISAGVVMNVITGILFAAMAYGFGVGYSPAIVGGVTPGGPAWQAGIEPGGKVLAIGSLKDDNMHFREMRLEILTSGLDTPDEPIDVAIEYDDGVRNFQLLPASMPANEDMRMIGVAIPESITLAQTNYAAPQSIAATVFSDADAGATVTSFNGIAINEDAIVPGTNFFDYVYSHPSDSIELTLRRTDDSVATVTLPPQRAKSIGVRYAIGPIVAMVANGPAAKAGLRVGDVITAVNGDANVDAYSLPTELVGGTEPITLTVSRAPAVAPEQFGEASDTATESIEITITPVRSLQTMSPTAILSGDIGINAYGFAYEPLATVARVLGERSETPETERLLPGDQLKEVRLLMTDDETPDYLKEDLFAPVMQMMREGQEFGGETPLNAFVDTIQYLPVGAKLEIKATRPPDGSVVTTTLTVTEDDRFLFDRGMVFPPRESVQKAESIGEGLALGYREGKRRLGEVFRFLSMLPRGRIGLKHVGGPLAIADIAKNEAEKGVTQQLLFLTMLSMNLAILNFLPIPALDGGHMMFLLYELVVGKRANEQLEFRLTIAGFLSLLALMVVVFTNDLLRFLN